MLVYHRTRKGRRSTPTERKLLCGLMDVGHRDIAELLGYLYYVCPKFSAGKIPDNRRAIGLPEPKTKWTTDTLTSWLQLVLRALHEQPPDGFAWTSRSLREGIATTPYNIGAPMQKMKFFGRSPRLNRPNNTPEPGSLATIWLDVEPHTTSHAKRRYITKVSPNTP
jgi:hypothetical protein